MLIFYYLSCLGLRNIPLVVTHELIKNSNVIKIEALFATGVEFVEVFQQSQEDQPLEEN